MEKDTAPSKCERSHMPDPSAPGYLKRGTKTGPIMKSDEAPKPLRSY
jgi:hypothetical protein